MLKNICIVDHCPKASGHHGNIIHGSVRRNRMNLCPLKLIPFVPDIIFNIEVGCVWESSMRTEQKNQKRLSKSWKEYRFHFQTAALFLAESTQRWYVLEVKFISKVKQIPRIFHASPSKTWLAHSKFLGIY